ncbi:MAG: hypothetical protein K2M06_03200 [Muribaculaceae bacterium]|nr:hypothetical protein [Muribaculaceae bacterium]
MKFPSFTKAATAISLVLLSHVNSPEAQACGPFYPLIPTPCFYVASPTSTRLHQIYKQENLRLWQQLTSDRIPLSDIEAVVYKATRGELSEMFYSGESRNMFVTYLKNTSNDEAIEFLTLAKRLEEARGRLASPWYYPGANAGYNAETGDFESFVEECKIYEGKRLKDRYGLQCVRALFAARRYDECVRYFEETFADIKDDNLFKRMSTDYIAGCWMHLGDTVRANEYFAQTGMMNSLKVANPVEYMAERNPDSAELLDYICDNINDSTVICGLEPLGQRVAKDGKCKNRGDWYFMLAYAAGEHRKDWKEARKNIVKALGCRFSSDELREHARAFRMKADAALGRRDNLLADLRWIEGKVNVLNPSAKHWERILQNIVYTQWTPRLWREKDYATAILLTGYAENIKTDMEIIHDYRWDESKDRWINLDARVNEMRKSEEMFNLNDYGSLTFQVMGSMSSGDLASAKARIDADKGPLFRHLKKHARTDADYFNELTGTLALREENYGRAVKYLSRVSPGYERTLNTYKEHCLQRDAFSYTDPRDKKNAPERGIKLDFARKMREYEWKMHSGRSADERAMATLLYTIGRYNAKHDCWALTQYWSGAPTTLFYACVDYWEELESHDYDFLWDEDYEEDYEAEQKNLNQNIQKILADFGTDEGRARAEYILGNLKTIVKRYPTTKTAAYVKSSCDRWKNWL